MGLTRTLHRGLRVLEVLTGRNNDAGVGVTEVAEATDLDKATTSRLLQTLASMDYVYQDSESRRYKLTGKLLALGDAYRRSMDLPQRARPYLEEIRGRTGETVHLGVRELDRVVYIVKLESRQTVQIASAVGQTMPLHTTALGKAILAATSADDREALLSELDLSPRTDRSITDVEELEAEILRTVDRGFAIDDRENEEAITCVGAAVVDRVGQVVGAISVSGPSYRMDGQLDEYGMICQDTAAQLGELI